jgi:hypothetical protein
MKSASHHAMGYLLYQALERRGITLDREMFVLGNLLPDYLPELILSPHFTMKCQREINVFTGVLAAEHLGDPTQIPAQYSLRLGILCHYVTDYFCFAHSREFKQNIVRHAAYEQALDDYFRAHYTERESTLPGLERIDAHSARECAQGIFRIKRQYKNARRDYASDVQFAFTGWSCFRPARSSRFARRSVSRRSPRKNTPIETGSAAAGSFPGAHGAPCLPPDANKPKSNPSIVPNRTVVFLHAPAVFRLHRMETFLQFAEQPAAQHGDAGGQHRNRRRAERHHRRADFRPAHQ